MNGTTRVPTRTRHGALAFGFALSLLVASQPEHADTPASLPAQLEIIWSTPITTEMTPQGTFGRSEGLVLDAVAMAPDGTAILLGAVIGGQRPGRVLLRDAEKAGPDAAVPLALSKPDSPGPLSIWSWLPAEPKPNHSPAVLSLALGAGGETWLSGFSNSYMGMASDVHRDAYLAKLDGAGKLVWERSYGTGRWLAIGSMAPTATGGVVGVGRGLDVSWLAKIAADGTLLMERGFGNGKGAVVVPLRDGRFLLAGFTAEGRAAMYQDDFSTWVLDEAGDLHGPTPVREALNRAGGSYYGHVAASAAADGAYVASNWSDTSRPQAVEVARVGPDGALLWRHALPGTISATDARAIYFNTCNPALATLADGAALVACALNGQIQLYRLDRDTGAQKAVRLTLPECQRDHPAALFLMTRRVATVLLGGSRPGNNVAGNCSWLGRLVMKAE